jgi:hypothetical protein
MTKIEIESSGRVRVGETVIMGIHAVKIRSTRRAGSEVTLSGQTSDGRNVARVYNAFSTVLVRRLVADFGGGVL